jgi:hypothetical protein
MMAEFKQGDDPKDHSVEEINAYLAKDGVEDAEIQQILAAEAAGKQRVTVVDPRTQAAAEPQADPAGADGDSQPAESAYASGGSKPYWYEETQGPAPEGADKIYTVVKVDRPSAP